ncbi:lipopolysaccharide assembly protein LapA domain-containing protein [Parasalinivibrio latis]|uniref:LapA family protein n=1 Tax=Parasalinivibrio latis TaxID=2952610 RepID=UPI0030E345E6
MKVLSIVILVVFFLVALALGSVNQELVGFNFLAAQGEFRLSTLLGGAFGLGFILGWLVCGLLYLRARFSARRLQKQVNKQQQELDKLRTEPVKE